MARANRRPKLASTAEHSSSSSSSSSPSATGTPPPVGDDEQQQHQPDFEKRARDLEIQNGSHQKEIEELRSKRSNSSVTPNDSMRKMKEGYLQKLNVLEEQVKELKKKQDVQSQLSMYRRKSEESTKHLQDEIQKLKAQKVQLQCKMKMESMQYRLCKASLEKEILQLKKEGRRNDYEMHKLLALNQRQKLVLQRKTKESSVATNRLRQLVESQKALLHMKAGSRKGNTSGIQLQAIEHELEVTSHISEICSEYEHQVEMMADEIMKIKEEAESLKQENLRHLLENKELECREDPELKDLKEDVVKLSCMLHKLEMPKAKFPPLEELQEDLSQSSLSIGSSSEQSNTSTHKAETCENVAAKGENASAICCSCSKKSLCKTMKCQCRVARGSCGTSCGCSHTKCTNRSSLVAKLNETIPTQVDKGNGHLKCSGSADAEKVLDANDVTTLQSVNGDSVAVKPDEIIPREAAEGNSKCSGSAEAEKSSILDSKDATATLNATVTVPAETNDNCGLKKMPLYDIANTLMKTFASKHNQRRKRRN